MLHHTNRGIRMAEEHIDGLTIRSWSGATFALSGFIPQKIGRNTASRTYLHCSLAVDFSHSALHW